MSDSIRSIDELPSIESLKHVAQGLALLDAIIMPQWEHRYFSFNCNWDGAGNEMMASMKDGSGAEYFIHFTNKGVAGKVLSESALPNAFEWLAAMPDKFRDFKEEPAFSNGNASLFFWRAVDQASWCASPDGLEEYPLLGFLAGGLAAYKDFAESYYEKNIDSDIAEKIFKTLTVTADDLFLLNPDISFDELEEDCKEILGRVN